MAGAESAKSPVYNTPTVLPSPQTPCMVEQARDRAASVLQAALDNQPPPKHEFEVEEPERWDGMS